MKALSLGNRDAESNARYNPDVLRRVLNKLRPASPKLDPLTATHRQAWRWARLCNAAEPLVDAIAARVDPESGFLDVGANIGYFSRALAERVQLRGVAHLFEPVPHLADLCRQTFADGRYRVVVHSFGLGDDNAEIPIYTASDGNLGWNTMVAGQSNESMAPSTVSIRRFDDLGLPLPGFVKIDVEGFEYRVLHGMLDSLRRAEPHPLILCEIGWGRGHPQWPEAAQTFQTVRDLGYRTTDLNGRPIDIFSLDRTTDVLFEPVTMSQP